MRIARLLNAYHHTTRVSFAAADIAVPDAYGEHYDVVLALGAFDRVGQVLARIAGITDGVFVTVVPDTDQSVAVIREAFEHHEVLGPAGVLRGPCGRGRAQRGGARIGAPRR